MTNLVHLNNLTSPERFAETAEILAALMRLRARKSSRLSANTGNSSLDCAADQSSHGAGSQIEEVRH